MDPLMIFPFLRPRLKSEKFLVMSIPLLWPFLFMYSPKRADLILTGSQMFVICFSNLNLYTLSATESKKHV